MGDVTAISTYVPAWRTTGGVTAAGADEDAVTMVVEAGMAVLGVEPTPADRVVLVSRELPLLEGGSAAVLLAGLGLADGTAVVEQVGGAPAVLDAISSAEAGTLVLAAELAGGAAAGAVLVGPGEGILPAARVQRSLPLRLRGQDGVVYEDHDPRLQRERGVRASFDRADLPSKPVAVAGLAWRDAAVLCEGTPPRLPTLGAASPIFALATLAEERRSGLVAAVEQASLSAAFVEPSGAAVTRLERPQLTLLDARPAPGPEIKFAYTAYDRAFDSKVRWEAGRCPSCGTLALPSRWRCITCGQEGAQDLVPLPRRGTVYTHATIHTQVPGLASPYTLAVVALDGVDVRALVTVTDALAGSVDIDRPGRLVLRRVATRSGVPDYGYAFQPDVPASEPAAVA